MMKALGGSDASFHLRCTELDKAIDEAKWTCLSQNKTSTANSSGRILERNEKDFLLHLEQSSSKSSIISLSVMKYERTDYVNSKVQLFFS